MKVLSDALMEQVVGGGGPSNPVVSGTAATGLIQDLSFLPAATNGNPYRNTGGEAIVVFPIPPGL